MRPAAKQLLGTLDRATVFNCGVSRCFAYGGIAESSAEPSDFDRDRSHPQAACYRRFPRRCYHPPFFSVQELSADARDQDRRRHRRQPRHRPCRGTALSRSGLARDHGLSPATTRPLPLERRRQHAHLAGLVRSEADHAYGRAAATLAERSQAACADQQRWHLAQRARRQPHQFADHRHRCLAVDVQHQLLCASGADPWFCTGAVQCARSGGQPVLDRWPPGAPFCGLGLCHLQVGARCADA